MAFFVDGSLLLEIILDSSGFEAKHFMNVNGFFNFVARAFRPSLAYSPLSRKSGFEKAQHPRFYPHLCTKPHFLSNLIEVVINRYHERHG